jgi:transcriptional regulator with XRE-family HTH domain
MIDIERLTSAMREKSVSQGELARAVGVSPPAIQQILNGKTRFTRHIEKIAAYLSVSKEWLEGASNRRETHLSYVLRNLTAFPLYPLSRLMDDSYESEENLYVDKRLMPSELVNDDQIVAVLNESDDMSPTLKKNAVFVISYKEVPERFDRQDAIWVLSYHDIVMVRRVRIVGPGRVALIPDNTTKPTIEADVDAEIVIGGRLLWVAQSVD